MDNLSIRLPDQALLMSLSSVTPLVVTPASLSAGANSSETLPTTALDIRFADVSGLAGIGLGSGPIPLAL